MNIKRLAVKYKSRTIKFGGKITDKYRKKSIFRFVFCYKILQNKSILGEEMAPVSPSWLLHCSRLERRVDTIDRFSRNLNRHKFCHLRRHAVNTFDNGCVPDQADEVVRSCEICHNRSSQSYGPPPQSSQPVSIQKKINPEFKLIKPVCLTDYTCAS